MGWLCTFVTFIFVWPRGFGAMLISKMAGTTALLQPFPPNIKKFKMTARKDMFFKKIALSAPISIISMSMPSFCGYPHSTKRHLIQQLREPPHPTISLACIISLVNPWEAWNRSHVSASSCFMSARRVCEVSTGKWNSARAFCWHDLLYLKGGGGVENRIRRLLE